MATIDGDNRNDLIIGTPTDDLIYGWEGIDLLRGGSGDDLIVGGDGPDSVYGDQGNDSLFGGEGDDLIRGGKGNDWIHGGAGRDMIRADLGDDTIEVWGGGADYIDGGPGRDTLIYDELTERVFIGSVSFNNVIMTRGIRGDVADVIENVEVFRLSRHDDVAYFSAGQGAIKVYGGNGNDLLQAQDNAILYGEGGNDAITITNGDGAVLYGGNGADHFRVERQFYGAPDALDVTIGGFTSGEDWISVQGVQDFDAIQAMLDGSTGDTLNLGLLGVDGMTGTLTLSGVDVSDLTVADFVIM